MMLLMRRTMLFAALLVVCACAQEGEPPAQQEPEQNEKSAAQPEDGPLVVPADTSPVFVRMETGMGEIYLELNREESPISVANFLRYVEEQHYDNTVFHRVEKGFLIQGGAFTPNIRLKPEHDPIKNEWGNGLRNLRGTIGVARRRPTDSGTAAFYINVKDSPNLDEARVLNGDAGYAVFGKVIAGMDVVDAINAVETHTYVTPEKIPIRDMPVQPVVIESVRVITEADADAAVRAEQSGTPTGE